MATLNDIAKLAGVSKATVSLALSDHPRISQETKKKIRSIADQLGYSMGKRAKASEQAQNRSIGVLFYHSSVETTDDFFKETLIGLSDACRKEHCSPVLIGAPAEPNEPSENIAQLVKRSGVSGAVVISQGPVMGDLEELAKSGFPLIFVGKRSVNGTETHYVASDNYGGGKLAAECLLDLGHRDIGIAVPPRSERNPWEEDRIDGFYAALRQAGAEGREHPLFVVSSPFSPDGSCWVQFENKPVTAVFAATPRTGLAVLQYMRHAHRAVPEDLSLIVFDDFASAATEQPPITVVRQDMESLGRVAAQLLFEIMENPPSSFRQLLLPTRLVRRASCCPIAT